jgi:tetratricopeptide (TPR) repeat protein
MARIFCSIVICSLALASAARAGQADLTACQNNDPAIAVPACTSMIDAGGQPGDVVTVLQSLRGAAYFRAGAYAKAIADLTQALRGKNDKPTKAAELSIRGAAYFFTGNTASAIADYTASIALVPDAGTYNARGLAYLKMKNYGAAIADYDIALKGMPNSPQALYGRGLAKLRLGDTAAADADMAKARSLQADVAGAFSHEGIDAKP